MFIWECKSTEKHVIISAMHSLDMIGAETSMPKAQAYSADPDDLERISAVIMGMAAGLDRLHDKLFAEDKGTIPK